MELAAQILGTGTVEKMQERIKKPILTIGEDRFTRRHLAVIDCFNFLAAATLSNIVATLKVNNTSDLYKRIPPSALALPGLGVISLATLGAAFEHKLGKTLTDYINHHRDDRNSKVVTFHTMKHNAVDVKLDRKAAKEEKVRKHARSNRAHQTRTDRFVARHPKTRTTGAPIPA